MGQEVSAYAEVAEFIAQMAPERVLAFKISAPVRKRVTVLLEKQQIQALTPEEKREVESYLVIDSLVSLAKARARLLIAHEPAHS